MSKNAIILPDGVEFIISRLESFGYRADIVGGCVRDIKLSKIPNDYDITTNALPQDMIKIFKDVKVVETGLKHGTLTVVYEGIPYEITTYRVDGEYADNRHPLKVSFTNELREDLSRRDFTINAMCYNKKSGFTDIFGGESDLEKKIIRAVGDPERRFVEDALRILRALRFASCLDFDIEEKTSSAIFAHSSLLLNVSNERIYSEWKKLLMGNGAERIIKKYASVIAVVIPEIKNIQHLEIPSFKELSSETREAILFYVSDRENYIDNYITAMKRLKCDNKRKALSLDILSGIDSKLDDESDVKALIMHYSDVTARFIIEAKCALNSSYKKFLVTLKDVLNSGFCYKLSELKINGEDLKSHGIVGREIGVKMREILSLVAEGKLENEKNKIIEYVTKIN